MEEKKEKSFLGRRFSRREFHKIAGTFGLTSTLLALTDFSHAGISPSAEELAKAASAVQKKRYKKPARYTWKFGAAGFNEKTLKIEYQGGLFFVRDIEERTEGELRIEFIGNNAICTQLTCVRKCLQGIVDLYTSSTQNASATVIYLNVLDFAYLWPSRAAQYYFFYHPKSEPLFREPLRKHYKLHFLWTHCELRDLMMGLKYKNKPKIMSIDALRGTKLRVTGTQLGRIAMQCLGTNPVPVAWEETLDGLKTGLLDGAETWSSAVAYANMAPYVSQDVRLGFFSGNEHTAMRLQSFEKLTPELQEAVMESAYATQMHAQYANEAGLLSVVGITDPPLPGTIYAKYGVRNCYLPKSEMDKAEQLSSPKYNPKPWEKWREKLNKLAGGVDIYEELYKIAREIPADMKAINVEPRRWWKA